jgi:hypothetical protein
MTGAQKVLEAEKEIRKEGAKAAFLHAAIETTLVFVAVFFVIDSSGVPWLPETVGTETVTVPVSAVAAVAVAVVFFSVDAALIYRSRTVEYFEEANPQVKEALRTARDAAKRDEDNEMAERLYGDVLEELRTTSSEGFVDVRRIVGSLALVVGVGALLLTASIGGMGFGDGLFGNNPFGGGGDSTSEQGQSGGGGGGERQYDELQDPDEVLGETGEVTRGEDNEEVELRRSGTGGDGSGETGSAGGGNDYTGGVEVESQRAEYSPDEEIDDAELVKEYNLKIRGEE